jgi:hypothetical protein
MERIGRSDLRYTNNWPNLTYALERDEEDDEMRHSNN